MNDPQRQGGETPPPIKLPDIEFPEAQAEHKRRAIRDSAERAEQIMRAHFADRARQNDAINGARQIGVIQGRREGFTNGWRWGFFIGTLAGGVGIYILIQAGLHS